MFSVSGQLGSEHLKIQQEFYFPWKRILVNEEARRALREAHGQGLGSVRDGRPASPNLKNWGFERPRCGSTGQQ